MLLVNKIRLYQRLLKQDEDGFIESHECDSLLFSSLVGCVPGIKVDIDKAFNGQTWERRQCKNPCFPDHSKSSISRDMLIGLCWYAYYNNRLDISESVINHAFKNKMIMGKGAISRIIMTPGLLATYAWVSYKLGGKNRWWLRWIPTGIPSGLEGYQAHLAVLHGLLRKDLSKTKKIDKTLGDYFRHDPRNPLFAIAVGKFDEAKKILKNQSLWPNTRLPDVMDRKPQWLMERDSAEWVPGKGNTVHSGGDFLFAVWLLIKKGNI